jgi:hypothetical protein
VNTLKNSVFKPQHKPHPLSTPCLKHNGDGRDEGHSEIKERFAITKYLLIIGKKKNMQVLSHTFAYFSA